MSGQSKQAHSWTDPYGSSEDSRIVGQIFFPHDGDTLDKDDTTALDALIEHYIVHLLMTPITLRLVGKCDHAGSDEYNEKLGMRRANAVRHYIDKTLGPSKSYISTSAVSFGEKLASGHLNELDRRVDIMSSYTPIRPRHITPQKREKRCVQFLLIEIYNKVSLKDPDQYIIQEKFSEILASHSYPHNVKNLGFAIHPSPGHLRIEVSRHSMEWRKPVASDAAKEGGSIVLKLLSFIGSNPHPTYDPTDEGVPEGADTGKSSGDSAVYSSWDAFMKSAKNKTQEMENKTYEEKYRGKPVQRGR